MKVTIKGFVHEVDFGIGDKEYCIFANNQTGTYYTLIGPAEFEYEVPDDFNPIPAKLAAIEAQKAKARKEFNDRIEELNEQASKLQALTFDGVVTA